MASNGFAFSNPMLILFQHSCSNWNLTSTRLGSRRTYNVLCESVFECIVNVFECYFTGKIDDAIDLNESCIEFLIV